MPLFPWLNSFGGSVSLRQRQYKHESYGLKVVHLRLLAKKIFVLILCTFTNKAYPLARRSNLLQTPGFYDQDRRLIMGVVAGISGGRILQHLFISKKKKKRLVCPASILLDRRICATTHCRGSDEALGFSLFYIILGRS